MASLTRDNVQLIINELWEQPTERFEETIVAKLPAPSFVLPRSKKCPVPRPLTKWEQFAKEKGIKKTKKDKKVYDEELEVLKNSQNSLQTHHIKFFSILNISNISISMLLLYMAF